MPVIADGISPFEVNRRDYCVFDADGSSPESEFTYSMAQLGEDYTQITLVARKDLNLSTSKKYRISIEEVDGR